jgi:fumarate hydratase subunit beta
MTEYHLRTPLTESDARKLRISDIVYLSGLVYTARDEAHIHILDELTKGHNIDIPLEGTVVYHCGPIAKKVGSGWKVIAAGPTTSSRMNSLEPEFIEKMHVRAIIGKGGMSKAVVEAMQKFGVVYLAFTGGAAVLAADAIKEVKGVYLEELGMPEAVWVLETDHFGPLIVGIDARGQSLYEKVDERVKENLREVKRKLGL